LIVPRIAAVACFKIFLIHHQHIVKIATMVYISSKMGHVPHLITVTPDFTLIRIAIPANNVLKVANHVQ